MTTIHNGSVVIFFVYFLQTLLTSVHRRRARMAARVAIRGPRLRVTVLSATKDYCAKQVSSPVTQFDDYTALTGHVVGVRNLVKSSYIFKFEIGKILSL